MFGARRRKLRRISNRLRENRRDDTKKWSWFKTKISSVKRNPLGRNSISAKGILFCCYTNAYRMFSFPGLGKNLDFNLGGKQAAARAPKIHAENIGRSYVKINISDDQRGKQITSKVPDSSQGSDRHLGKTGGQQRIKDDQRAVG